jgi:hypothetical protein
VVSVEVPVTRPRTGRFVQLTADGRVGFPTFGEQTFEAFAHSCSRRRIRRRRSATRTSAAGHDPTMRMLEQGGDRLAWLESRYTVPVTAVRLPFVGNPYVTLRHIVGGAGVGRLPALTQNVGLRVGAGGVRIDFVVDPAEPRRNQIAIGVGLR